MGTNTTRRKRRVALYLRPLPHEPDNSLQARLTLLQDWARHRDAEVVRVYFDTMRDRTWFQRMTEEATQGDSPFDEVLVTDRGHVCPSERLFRQWEAIMETHGVVVLAAQDLEEDLA